MDTWGSKFLKKGGSDFFHKTRGVGKIGAQGGGGWGCFKREGVSVMFKLTLSSVFFQYLSVCLVCVCVLFTPFPSVLFVFHRKNLVL